MTPAGGSEGSPTVAERAPEPVVELSDLVVTGTRTMHRIDEAPVRTELLTARELDLAGARCLADSVELLPGVRVENNCQNCGTSDILLLGLEGKYTSVLFDGVPLLSGLAAVYGLDQIPSAFVDRIEVVKGGGSAVYGSGAVGGVVNIIGRVPARSGALFELRHDRVAGEPATQATAILDHVTPDRARTLSVYGQVASVTPVDLNDDGFSDLTKRELSVVGARLTQESGPGRLRLDYSHTDEFRRGGNRFDQPDPLADISERIDTVRDAASLFWGATVSPDVDYVVTAGAAHVDRETFYGGLFGHAPGEPLTPESSPGAGDNDQPFIDRGYATHGQVAQDQFGYTTNWLVNLEAQVNVRRADHLVSAGLQYYREHIDDLVPVSPFVSGYPAAPDVATGDSLAVFVQDDWHVSEAWELVLGLRADRHSELDRVVLSPRVAAKWVASDALTWRASLGTGFRAPQPFDEDLHIELIAGERAKTVQSDDLREERSVSALLGATWNPEFSGGRLSIEAAGFFTRLDGTFTNSAIFEDPETGERMRTRDNGPDAAVGGFECNIGTLPAPDLRLDLGWVVQWARYASPVVLVDDGTTVVTERDFLETPRHYAVAQATYSREGWPVLAVNATYTGAMKAINLRTGVLNGHTDSFVVWNATVSRSWQPPGWPQVTLGLGVKNLLDARQDDLESGVDRDPYYLYGPRTPRTFFASARFGW